MDGSTEVVVSLMPQCIHCGVSKTVTSVLPSLCPWDGSYGTDTWNGSMAAVENYLWNGSMELSLAAEIIRPTNYPVP